MSSVLEPKAFAPYFDDLLGSGLTRCLLVNSQSLPSSLSEEPWFDSGIHFPWTSGEGFRTPSFTYLIIYIETMVSHWYPNSNLISQGSFQYFPLHTCNYLLLRVRNLAPNFLIFLLILVLSTTSPHMYQFSVAMATFPVLMLTLHASGSGIPHKPALHPMNRQTLHPTKLHLPYLPWGPHFLTRPLSHVLVL